MPEPECPHCGTPILGESRFCPECGRRLEAGLLDAPLFGRPRPVFWPPDPLVLIALLIGIGGIILLVGGAWAWGMVALLAAVVIVLAQTQLAGRTARQALIDIRARAFATREAMAARSREQVEIFRSRRELAELHAERSRLFRDLGYAVYHEDEKGTNEARSGIASVDERIRKLEEEIERMRQETMERVERAQGPAKPTERMETGPGPVRVPEPWPPPDEGDVPGPPTPAPGEPVPGPEEPAPPQHPPMPQTGASSER